MPGTVVISDINQHAVKNDLYQWGVHGGWCVGAVVAFVGTIQKHRRSTKRTVENSSNDSPKNPPKKRRVRKKAKGVLSSMGGFGLVGGIIGLLTGASFALLWFSIAYSPFAPQCWVSSVSVERTMKTDSASGETTFTTRHPVAIYAFGAPIVLGVATGMIVGGVGAAMGKVKDVD